MSGQLDEALASCRCSYIAMDPEVATVVQINCYIFAKYNNSCLLLFVFLREGPVVRPKVEGFSNVDPIIDCTVNVILPQ